MKKISHRWLESLRSVRTVGVLERAVAGALKRRGFGAYAYTCFAGAASAETTIRIGGGPDGVVGALQRHAPLADLSRRRIAPFAWQASDHFRFLEITDDPSAPGSLALPRRSWWGATVPVHGPGQAFGLFVAASRDPGIAGSSGACLPEIHALGVAVHETAMRNCSNTRFGLHYTTVDAVAWPAMARGGNGVELPTIH